MGLTPFTLSSTETAISSKSRAVHTQTGCVMIMLKHSKQCSQNRVNHEPAPYSMYLAQRLQTGLVVERTGEHSHTDCVIIS